MYAVIGANGYLGSYIVRAIQKLTGEKIVATARDLTRVKPDGRAEWVFCDVRSDESVAALTDRLAKEKDVKIVYLAAYHNPDDVARHPETAWDINVTCLSKFLNKARFARKIYYASTDSVYGESENGRRFKESDPLTPVNVYGRQKCAAEALMIQMGRNVVRFPFLISPSLVYKPHFYDKIVESLRAGKPVEMFEDSLRSSLSFENAAALLIRLTEKDGVPSVVNVCGDKDLSKYDVGLLIADREGLDRRLIVPVSVRQSQGIFATGRANSTLMDNALLKSLLGLREIDIFDDAV